ncbi:hypothetical protein EMIT0P44_260067 [Pseudomonas sp. IT-P44]|jgi:hypothetical protein|uniref:hypothetical protein n=1 Tax=unclassified Pseudomonas TaxID=196821 RepID=UPI001780A418|nr:hypothetical protein [Pseudomonas sp. PDM02]MBD9611831.1 hypothetical protein [Pseudomonas sp. PDM02]
MTIQINSGLAGIQPVYICYGAPSHTLRVKGAEDSPWVGHGASLNHAAGDSSLITAEPGYGELQTLRAEGSEWKLNCPADGMDRDFDYWIQSEFTAAPYKIPMRLGHYRREILGSRSPIRAPVIGDTVKAEITVGSYYTKQELEGVPVDWKIDGETLTVPTSESGVSQFTYIVKTLGAQTITAELHSPYDDKTVKKSFEINVHKISPWKEAKLFINEIGVMWGDSFVLTRGSANTVRVEVAPEIAKVLRLEVGEGGDLSLVSNPPFNSEVSPVGETFNWTVTPDDGLSGSVTLVIFSPDVALPWDLPCLVMSADLADEVDEILVGGVVSPDGVVFFRNEPQTVTVTYKPGSPLQGYPLKLTGTPLTGVQPGDLVVTPGNGHTWSVAASNRSGTFKLKLEGVGIARGITLPVSKVLSRILADEVTVQIDGQDAVAGSTYFRGEEHTLTLVPKLDSPIAGHGVGLWLGGSSLVTCDPPAETFTGVHSWIITFVTNESGLFYFEFMGKHFGGGNIKIDANKLLSRNLADEVTVQIDGKDAVAGSTYFRGEEHTLTLVPKLDSPIEGHGVGLWLGGSSLVTCNPPAETFTGVHSWIITFATNESGLFYFELKGKHFGGGNIKIDANKLLSRNLADEVTVQIDGKDAVAGSTYFRGGVHTLTLVPKPGSQIAGHGVGLWLGRSPLVTCNPPPETFSGLHTWTITLSADTSGLFNLELAAENFGRGNIKIDANKLLSRNLADEVKSFLLDGVAIPPTGADFDGRKINTLSLDYKNAGLLNGVPISLELDEDSSLIQSDFDCTPRFRQLSTPHNWKIKSAMYRSGTFRLKISTAVDSNDGAMLTPVNRLLAPDFTDTTLKFQAGLELAPVPPEMMFINLGILFGIVVRLHFQGGAPVVGMPVKIVVPGKGTYSGKTGAGGGFISPYISFSKAGVKTVTAEATLSDGTLRSATVLFDVRSGIGE